MVRFFGSQSCVKSTQKSSVIMSLEDRQKVEVTASQPKSLIKMLGLVFINNFHFRNLLIEEIENLGICT